VGDPGGVLLAIAFFLLLALVPVSVCALLTVPACLAVRHLIVRRFAVPLQRDSLEAFAVLGFSLAGACTAVCFANAIAHALDGTAPIAQALLVFIAPAPLGVIPWAAGELLSGESETPRLALVCSIGATYVLALGSLSLHDAGAFATPSAWIELATSGAAALAGAGMYLGMRGGAIARPPPEAVALLRVLSTPAR